MTRDALGIQRLELPPAVHFDRAAHLTVTSVHAATIAAQNTQRGAWVTVDGFLQQVLPSLYLLDTPPSCAEQPV